MGILSIKKGKAPGIGRRVGTALLVALVLCGCSGDRPVDSSVFSELPPGMSAEFLLDDSAHGGSALFSEDRPLQMILAADFSALDDDRDQESERRPARILVRGLSGAFTEVPLEVNTRGRFRLQRNICPDPPLRLRFQDSVRVGTAFDGQGRLKLVTHCRDNETYHQNLLEEYVAYRLYNLLTDLSFRVRLVEITYLDTSGEREPRTRMGFVIEDEDLLAARVGGSMVELESTRPDQFVRDQLGLMYLFHYMIGNVDWGTSAGHNVKLLELDGGLYPIPYDFDWSGLVDAPYSTPNRLTEPFHETVRQRLYWGVCMPGIDYDGLFAKARAIKGDVYLLLESIPGLSPANRESAKVYLEAFFGVIEDSDVASREIVQACRPWL